MNKINIWNKKKRGVTWFWGVMLPGETGSDLWKRIPECPDWARDENVFVWTKVTAGKDAKIIAMLITLNGPEIVAGIYHTRESAHDT